MALRAERLRPPPSRLRDSPHRPPVLAWSALLRGWRPPACCPGPSGASCRAAPPPARGVLRGAMGSGGSRSGHSEGRRALARRGCRPIRKFRPPTLT
eukprot:3097924-Alexandrium_andersonii.AAC.1